MNVISKNAIASRLMAPIFTRRAPPLSINRVGILTGLIGLATWPVSGLAQDRTWTGAVDNHWQEAGNWVNGLPIFPAGATIDNGDFVFLDSNAPAAPSAGFIALAGTSDLNVSNGANLGAGQLRVGVSTAGTMTVTGSGTTVTTLNMSGSDILIGSYGGNGTLNITDGAVVTTTTNATNEVILASVGGTGTLNLQGAIGSRGILETNRIGTPSSVSSTGSVNFDGGILRALKDEGSFLVGANTDVTILDGGAFIDTNGNSVGIALPIDGTGNLTKQGTGTLTLSGTNTYSGGTTVSEGTLAVNNTTGSGTGTGDVTVNNGATLGGDGTIGGNLIVNNGGTLAPGNSPGTLTVGVDLTLAGLTVIEITSDSLFDRIDVGGALHFGGDLFLDFSYLPSLSDTFDLFDFASQSGGFNNVTFNNSNLVGNFDNTSGILSLTAVPEPELFSLLAGILGLGLAATRRRR